MINGRQRRYIAIGYTDQHGPLCCYQVEWLTGDHSHQLIYLYTGSDRYQLWRHYYSALAAAEEEQYLLPKSIDRPRVSEVNNISREAPPKR